MKQKCQICGKTVETGGYGGLPMKQHYKHKHPDEYYSDSREEKSAKEGIEGKNQERLSQYD